MQGIKAIDYYLLPVYIILATLFIRGIRRKLNPDNTSYKIYYWAFIAKLSGGLAFAFITQYYYGYGDSLTYFREASTFHDYIKDDISNLKYFFSSISEYKSLYNSLSVYDQSNLMVVKITAFFTLFSFNTYLTTTIFFALISFSGTWAIYITFISIAPQLKKQFAWGILYLPSVIFWSSGVMKDSISIAALGWVFFFFYRYFILKKRKNIYLAIIFFSCYLIFVIKFYIIIAFAATFLLVGIFYLLFGIKNLSNRIISIVVLITALCLLIFTDNSINDFISNISFEMIGNNIIHMQKVYVDNNSVGEGNFSIGDVDPTLNGILSKIPLAVTTVLYRPFVWESKKIIMFFSGLENLILMLLSIYVIVRSGILNFFKIISINPLVQFCLFFTIIFAIIVGLTTFNFGTMLRYKVPCMPFYTSFLILVNYYADLLKKNKLMASEKIPAT